MIRISKFMFAAVVLTLAAAGLASAQGAKAGLNVPVTYYKLPNGLKVVLSPEHSAPLTTVAVSYNMGLRIEPTTTTGLSL